MKEYVNPAVRMLSTLVGAVAALLCLLILSAVDVTMPWAWSLMLGAGITTITAVVLALVLVNHDQRYKDIPTQIGEPIRLTVNANVTVDDVSRNGYLYLTDNRLFCFFRDREPYTKMAFERHFPVCMVSPLTLEISVSNHTFEIVCAECEQLVGEMRSLGWSVSENPSFDQ